MERGKTKLRVEWLHFCLPLETASWPPVKYVRPKTANFDHSTHPYTQIYALVLPTPYPCTGVFSEHIFEMRWNVKKSENKMRIHEFIHYGIRAFIHRTNCFGFIYFHIPY